MRYKVPKPGAATSPSAATIQVKQAYSSKLNKIIDYDTESLEKSDEPFRLDLAPLLNLNDTKDHPETKS
jgi:hypothetical protein